MTHPIRATRFVHTLALFLTLTALGIPRSTHAQVFTASGTLVTEIIDSGSTLAVTVSLSASPAIDLGSSNVAFTFNTDALQFPASPVKGTNYIYLAYDGVVDNGAGGTATYQSTVTRSGNEVSVNIGLATLFNGAPLPDDFVDVVTLFFDITDPSQTSELMWSFLEVSAENFMEATGYAFTGEDAPLPVELVSFAGQADGSAVVLSWQTASETNNAGFEIQHHVAVGAITCGQSQSSCHELPLPWQTLNFVEGHGTTLEAQTYSHHIGNLAAGRHRFRLKQIDYDGTFAYSPEVEVSVGVAGSFVMSAAYPNPFNPQTAFSLAVPTAQEVEIAVFDVLGRQVDVLFAGEMAANQTRAFVWEAGDRPSGLYFIRAVGERFAETRQVTLLK